MRRTRASCLLVLAALAAAAPRVRAAGGADSLEFLLLDGHARPAGLGGAYTALAADASALHYNPAGLGRIRVNEAAFTHNQFVQSVTHQQISVVTREGLGMELGYLDFGKVPRTTLSRPDGTGDTAGLSDLSASVGYGLGLGEWSFGGAGKYLREKADRVTASGYAVDLGALYAPERVHGLTLGAALLNAGPDVKYDRLRQRLPAVARAGAAYAFTAGGNDNTVSADVSRARADSPVLALGVETVFTKSVAFRLGYTMANDAGFGLTGGVGWLWERFVVGYAFSPLGELGLAHRVTLTMRWGEGMKDEDRPRFSKRPATDEPGELMTGAEEALAKGDLEGAKRGFSAAAPLFPSADARRVRCGERLGTVLLRLGKNAAAREAFIESLREAQRLGVKDASVTDAYVGLGLISVAEGNGEYALRLFLKALYLNPKPETKALLESKIAGLRAADPTVR